ncbi:MAG: DNA replication and repair protein RecF [Chitinophagaceae bacterium]|nr:MAG: DNA replication and repair protein RecF [Bacteroidetes bacterium OLB11]MCC6448627.1 DNA replication and repair protein RecF [Chitinophagaceae bacterium]HMN32287.1 DNA replication and repair protein RecF [Chitinophagaceae bacterium]
MKVQSLSLYHFKNYIQSEFKFDGNIVCIVGKNGSGKTTILDAIYFLCFTKSYFINNDSMCISANQKGMMLKAHFLKDSLHEVQCTIRENGKKEFSKDKILYTHLSKHIGEFSVVMVTPDDTQLITETSEIRRKYLDVLISQLDSNYMNSLISYNKILQQRNALLKNNQGVDYHLLDYYDEQLASFSVLIFEMRKKITLMIADKTMKIYHFLSPELEEEIQIQYSSPLMNGNLTQLLKASRQKDIITQRSNVGIHKDDLIFTLHGMPLKNVASQGQRKSFLYGLKFAQYEILLESNLFYPVLLLDDVFEKLDYLRGEKIIEYISKQTSQVFITDTHKERLENAFIKVNQRPFFIEL